MDQSRKFIRTFDAFPKIPSSQEVRSSRGSLSSIMTYVFMLFLLWVEIGGYIDGYVDHQFSVDEIVRKDLRINLDMIVAMPCNYIDTNVRDTTDDRFLAAELLNYQGTTWNIPRWFFESDKKTVTPELEEVLGRSVIAEFSQKGVHMDGGQPACRIYGYVPVNKVRGDFHITAKGFGYRDRTITPREALNFTHVITEFSFGEFYPYLDNPLDMTIQTTDQQLQTFQYQLRVVPTLFKKLGLEVDTNQFSTTSTSSSGKYVPGIFFKYDFEPIKLIVEEKRLSFFQFTIRIITIFGGIMVIASWLYKLMDKLILITLGREFLKRGEEKKDGGLLDAVEDFEKI
ncbi:hypothetical protein CANARDRAFT_7559 [[Candida] arabinofermentans NRRL YB-2248]|uniref:Endoplasmic reticulum-Golgi intermediate compartment protein n=1 Tax=[Candida] arabinofermentans NRRL YB-2248 TaxID=983967 RepID=A0A1E4T115_9ASCO|nr:hypothetical protein CANARDRAFT_7559 [[Candida] arabinofermentans NRRL YB-2248]